MTCQLFALILYKKHIFRRLFFVFRTELARLNIWLFELFNKQKQTMAGTYSESLPFIQITQQTEFAWFQTWTGVQFMIHVFTFRHIFNLFTPVTLMHKISRRIIFDSFLLEPWCIKFLDYLLPNSHQIQTKCANPRLNTHFSMSHRKPSFVLSPWLLATEWRKHFRGFTLTYTLTCGNVNR